MTLPLPSRRFDGHVAWVTGAGRGIGAAVARRLAAEGARVLVTDALAERAERAAAAIDAAEPFPCDVGDDDAVRATARHAIERFGRLDVLVNNACSCHADADRLEDQDDASWFADFDVTLHGAFRCARAALPHLAASGRGAIVNIGSVNAEVYFGSHAYSAAKAGLASFTRTLAVRSAPRGVRVNLVEPGTVRTDVWAGHEALLERARHCYPLGRVGEPDDIAAAVAFLASRDAAWVTGVTLPVDGGLLVSNLGMNAAFEGPV